MIADKDISTASQFTTVTPSAAALARPTRAVYVGGAGNLVVTSLGGNSPVTFHAVPAGSVLPIQITHLLPGTTASHIVGLY